MKADFPTKEAFEHAAWMLRCEVYAIEAIAKVEVGPLGAFYDDGTPTILYERHQFHRLTMGKHVGKKVTINGVEYDLSHPKGGGYGPSSVQHKKLQAAENLNKDAARRACSWGLFQIMGFNHAKAGFPNLQRFINAMFRDVDDHLRALVLFIRNDERLVDAVRDRNWASFALHYNGSDYRANDYDGKMARAYEALSVENK